MMNLELKLKHLELLEHKSKGSLLEDEKSI